MLGKIQITHLEMRKIEKSRKCKTPLTGQPADAGTVHYTQKKTVVVDAGTSD